MRMQTSLGFDRDPNFMTTIPQRYKQFAVPADASNTSTTEASATCMDRAGPEFLEARGKTKIRGPLYIYDVGSTICKCIYNVTNKY